ncbi:hypothetical protein [Streptomyces sp. NPDC127084]|uniref:hypothetical protein n=1 Tax=Streptomyces sp. NPDC127084 TaxID=3347133 RepID=UPI00365189FE
MAPKTPVDLPFPAKSARSNTRDQYFILRDHGPDVDLCGAVHIATLGPGEAWSGDKALGGMYECCPEGD